MIPRYSVVVPLKDEEENVDALIHEVESVMSELKEPWEMICIDDGSSDNTLSKLQSKAGTKPFLRILVFKKNYGQSSAFDAGFKAAKGEVVITLDGDLQNDPKDIPKLLETLKECDLACGCRVNRKDPFVKRITSKVANSLRSRLCQDGISDTGCSLKAYRSACLMHIKMFNGMHRFLPALFKNEGFRVREVAVGHRPRSHGKTKYSFLNRSFNTISDMFAVCWMRKRHLGYRIDKELP